MLKIRAWLLRGIAVTGAALLACLPAGAHPHMWVTVKATVLYANGAFVGIRHKWTFDEYYTATAIEGLDKNKDGIYDRAELAELAKVNIDALKDFDYFTFPALDGQAVKLGEPTDYWLEYKDGLLSLLFTTPFASPVLANAKGFTFSVHDPSFFIAFELAKADKPVQLGEGAPNTCHIKMDPAEQRDTAQLGPMQQLGGVVSLGQDIAVECETAK
ncbi:MAG: DUF1007 family protein [Hyphomicrobiaceae bacterium]|nr:DUF1007 family protein [Hyphomicrobiaceae bacterium]